MHPSIKRSFYSLVIACILTGIFGCAGRGGVTTDPNRPRTVAVWDIVDYSPSVEVGAEAGDIFTSKLMETIQMLPDITLVEREKLALVLEELNIGSAAIADPETQLKLGEILGASDMVFGGYQVFGDTLRLDIRRVDVETGKILKAVDKTMAASDMAAWLTESEAAARELFQ